MKEKNFKFRKSFGALIEKMTDKQAGEFIKSVCGYVFDGKPMESKDDYLKGLFLYVQSVLDAEVRDRENGKIGGAIIAERCKEKRNKMGTEKQTVSESNLVSQLIIVSTEGQGNTADAARKGKPVMPERKYGCFKKMNA